MKQTSTRDFSSISALLSYFDSLCFFDDVHSPAEDRLLFVNNLFYPSFFCFLFFSVSNFVGSRLFVCFFSFFFPKPAHLTSRSLPRLSSCIPPQWCFPRLSASLIDLLRQIVVFTLCLLAFTTCDAILFCQRAVLADQKVFAHELISLRLSFPFFFFISPPQRSFRFVSVLFSTCLSVL